MRRTLLLVGAPLLLACASPPHAPDALAPAASLGPPRILSVAGAHAIDEPTLLARLAASRFVLLGEAHDNVAHHRLQARVIRDLVARGEAPAVVFEMLRVDQQGAIDAALAANPGSAAALREATGWDESGWPDWSLYEPVFAAALDAELPIVAGDLGREELALLRAGMPQPALASELGLAEPLPPELEASLAEDIEASHCGYVHEAMLPAMIRVQRARDARLAHSMQRAAQQGGTALLIAGAGHVRLDRGVPRALARLAPGDDVASLAFLELASKSTDPWPELALRELGRRPFDYIWVTDPQPREDPCEQFKEQLEKMPEDRT